jgi:hypothetical protein
LTTIATKAFIEWVNERVAKGGGYNVKGAWESRLGQWHTFSDLPRHVAGGMLKFCRCSSTAKHNTFGGLDHRGRVEGGRGSEDRRLPVACAQLTATRIHDQEVKTRIEEKREEWAIFWR